MPRRPELLLVLCLGLSGCDSPISSEAAAEPEKHTYRVDSTFLTYNSLRFSELADYLTVPVPQRSQVEIELEGSKATVLQQCQLSVESSDDEVVATDAACELLEHGILGQFDVVRRTYRTFDLDLSDGNVLQVVETEHGPGWTGTDSLAVANGFVLEEGAARSLDVKGLGLDAIWTYSEGQFTTYQLREQGEPAECGEPSFLGRGANGRIRDLGGGRGFLEGFNCTAPIMDEALPEGGSLEPCEPGESQPTEVPLLFLRQLSLRGDRLVMLGEMRKHGHSYCVSMEALASRSETIEF